MLPDWGKIEFYKYAGNSWEDILRGASSNSRDLVSKLIRYESSQRYSAAEVRWAHSMIGLKHTLTFCRR